MPRRIVFRDARGRFARSEDVAESGGSVEIFDPVSGGRSIINAQEYFSPEPIEVESSWPQWQASETDRGYLWDGFPEDFDGSFQPEDWPDDADGFRVILDVEGDADYPRGHASTGWMTSDLWPPSLDMIRGVTATGFNQIRFRRR